MDISPKLQMNLHPKDAENLSLVTALNVKLSNDESCITNEESIRENTFIYNFLREFYKSEDNVYNDFTIIAIIPCNTELAILAIANNNQSKVQIFRYREKTSSVEESMKCVYGDNDTNYFKYHGGKIKGTFTYNVENSLILAIAEYDGNEEKIPLRTINLGNYDDDTIFSDKDIPDELLSIAPEIRIPFVDDISLKYISGNAYKGWYYLFIRYKINSTDYTQWFNFGFPIFVDTLEKYAITKYCYRQKTTNMNIDGVWKIIAPEEPEDGFCAGASDYFSNTSDIANETFSVDLDFTNVKNYNKYQIGVICASKSYTKSFKTDDIVLKDKLTLGKKIENFTFNKSFVHETSANDFIIDNYNYFDVKNIINYKNKLYISNYKENNANNKNIIDSKIVDEIDVDILFNSISANNIVNDCTITSVNIERDVTEINSVTNNRQYEGDSYGNINCAIYFNIDPNIDTIVRISGKAERVSNIYLNPTITKLGSVQKEINISGAYVGIRYTDKNGKISRWKPSFICIYYTDINGDIIQFIDDVVITFINDNGNNVEKEVWIHTNYAALNGQVNYINTNKSFNQRKQSPVFIPGEIYNFFIHYVDKYGHCTNGYKITNKYKYVIENTEEEICPISFKHIDTIYYAAVPINEDLLFMNKLNLKNISFYKYCSSGANGHYEVELSRKIEGDELNDIKNTFIALFRHFEHKPEYSKFKWYQVISCCDLSTSAFVPYYNNNEEKLFRFPLHDNVSSIYGYKLNFKNIKIPQGYIGYFISYEKFESIKKVTGLLTRNDFRSQNYIENKNGGENFVSKTTNQYPSDIMYFYSDAYDIADSIKLDYNIMRIDGKNVWDNLDIPDWFYAQRGKSYKYCHDMNKPQIKNDFNITPTIYPMPKYKLAIANSAVDNRVGVGTALQIQDSYYLFYDFGTKDNNLYKVTLFNMTRNIYMSNNKTLIRCSNIMYADDNFIPNETKYSTGYDICGNGYATYQGHIIYENAGLNFNTADNKAYRIVTNTLYYPSENAGKQTYEINCPFLAYIQTPIIDTYFHESKCFKNEPASYMFFVKYGANINDKQDVGNKFQAGCIVTPQNSIDLFENRQDGSDTFNVKTFTNYREDLVSVDNFEKTVRRSSVIQDETRINGWRTFPIEAYKNITENKGIITNIVGIGTIFLVHTEHSLFMFDTSNTLETKNKTIQLNQPDAFEVDYKEVFTSDLGYGGLQNDKSYVIDQFGYIFYNNDFNRFYNFDNGQLITIDDDIIQWLDKYKPYNVRFANDKFNNRIIIKMNYNVNNIEKHVVMSYNYNTKHFVSLHDYYFDEAFNTKSKLYLKCDYNNTNCSLHQFVQDGSSYGSFDNVKGRARIIATYPSRIAFIVNEQYSYIKFLEYISYKLNKFANPTKTDYTNSPVERTIIPYSADYIRAYNNEVDTGRLDVLINKEDAKNVFGNYEKPYWELGNWNYNYFRNNIDNAEFYGDAFIMSRIFGNYIIIEFTFSNTDNLKVEFEELKYSISK